MGPQRFESESPKVLGPSGSSFHESDPPADVDRRRYSILANSSRPPVEETEQLLRPRDGSYLDFVENRYGHLRKFAPLVLRVLDFKSLKTDDPLIDAVEILRELNRKRRRRVPEDAGLEFASAKWRGQLLGSDGRVNRRSFEICVLYQLRDGLRSGAIWLQGSRRFADPATYLIPSAQWTSRRSEALRILGLEQEPREHLEALANSTEAVLQHLGETEINESETLRLEEGRIVLSPASMEELPDEVVQLHDLVAERLPRVEPAEVLIEVDSWTGFTQFFRHAGGARSRNPDLVRHVYAAILAQACNFGLTTRADIADLTYRQLAWTTDWYLREKTLKAAFSALGDFQHQLPLAEGLGRWNPLLLRWPAIPRSRLGGERDRAPEILRPRKGPHFLHLDLGPVLAVRVEGHLVYGS